MSRLLILEDAPDSARWLAERLRMVWGADCDIDIATTLGQARQLLARTAYDVALVDLSLPDGSGLELLREQQQRHGGTRCIVTTIHDDDEHLFGALRAGAQGYLLKESPAGEIESALRGLREGVPPLSPAVALRMMEFFSAPRPALPESPLTGRERDVLALIAQGMSVVEVSAQLELSAHTVRGYVKEIYRKLEISSRAEASLKASRLGLIRG